MSDESSIELKGNTDETVLFLRVYCGDSSILLVAFLPDDRSTIEARTFNPTTQETELRAWIDKRQGIKNLYFTVNIVYEGYSGDKKCAKEDIAWVRGAHVDIDQRPNEGTVEEEKLWALDLLEKYEVRPDILIDSGNGIQAFWPFKEPIKVAGNPELLALFEGINNTIMRAFSGDKCWNIDRIMRLPGTINMPDKGKRKKGRVPVLAKLMRFDTPAKCTPDMFKTTGISRALPPSADVISIRPTVEDIPDSVDLDSLPASLSEETRALIMSGKRAVRAGGDGSRSATVWYVVGQCLHAGCSDGVIASILMDARYGISESIREKGRHTRNEALRQIEKAKRRYQVNSRPLIEVEIGNLDKVLNKIEEAIIETDHAVYQHYGDLIHLGVQTENGPLGMIPVSSHWLLEKMISSGRWVRKTAKGLSPMDPKISLAEHYLARKGGWRVPYLNALMTHPVLRADRTLITTEGYDPESRIYLDFQGVDFPAINREAMREDGIQALEQLCYLIRHMPYVPDDPSPDWVPGPEEGSKPSAARSVTLAAILGGIDRHNMKTMPIHGVTAPERGTGKSLLVDYVSIILTGQAARPITFTDKEEENEKRILSILLGGDPVIVFGNIEHMIRGDTLCSIITSPHYKGRILGRSEMKMVDTRRTIMVEGNNLSYYGDTIRRHVTSCLDARMEQPYSRQFDGDLTQEAKRRRPQLVVAALTMMIAYTNADCPLKGKVPHMGSFEDYTFIRECLIWYGQPDPLLTQRRFMDDDPVKMAIGEMMRAWWPVFFGEEKSISTVLLTIKDPNDDKDILKLQDCIMGGSRSGKPTIGSLGKWFQKYGGKVVGGKRFVIVVDEERGMLIRLDTMGKEMPLPGEDVKF